MSTNYYVHTNSGQEIHLGKYAQGHAFMFRGYPERGVADLASWAAQVGLGEIRTEAGALVTPDELMGKVADARRLWGRFKGASPRSDQHDDHNGNRFTNAEFC